MRSGTIYGQEWHSLLFSNPLLQQKSDASAKEPLIGCRCSGYITNRDISTGFCGCVARENLSFTLISSSEIVQSEVVTPTQ
ncbi:hypothetical protein GDO78_002019 [Eleutherodactylus coqui]|uniref:Uncharacterized protein n=1 Tax=Eleutherodactylus coqui TaxID=57060 RepID=A0A8J6KHW7_ELECQ|nr:hypothetical protein GDO78_002019 [Eleutherodactylus coqui]